MPVLLPSVSPVVRLVLLLIEKLGITFTKVCLTSHIRIMIAVIACGRSWRRRILMVMHRTLFTLLIVMITTITWVSNIKILFVVH